MHLKKLDILNFKNYSEGEFEFSERVNCFTGNNGSGKTNILDAIYYLSFCKSYFHSSDKVNIKHGESFFAVKGIFDIDQENDQIYCAVQEGKKKIFKRNEKAYEKLADHIGRYPAVIITPNDSDLIREGSSIRRKFIDGIISQYNKDYLYTLIDYNKILLHRNNLLKHFKSERKFSMESLEIWDMQLVSLGAKIFEERKKFLIEFKPYFLEYYGHLSGGNEEINLEYKSDLHSETMDNLLEQSLENDRYLCRTSKGIHKDDLEFKIHDHPIKSIGSQGQQKSFLICLKLAQFQFIKKATGKVPLLLLDDVFDKIDDERIGFLMELVSKNSFGQIFITDTHQGRVSELFEKIEQEVKEFSIHKGSHEKIEI